MYPSERRTEDETMSGMLGKGRDILPGMRGDPKRSGNTNHSCSNCGGVGYVRCRVCHGKGTLHHNDDQKA